MKSGRESDMELMKEIPKEKLIDLLFLQMRNLWTVDGLYFLGIEERIGTQAATDIDMRVWEVMGKIEARRIKETFGFEEDDIPTLMEALRLTSWSLDLENKEITIDKEKAVFRNTDCRVQNTRIKKGLNEFPCKNVRWGYLKSFAREFNEKIAVECKICPPDEHTEKLWCEWQFRLQK